VQSVTPPWRRTPATKPASPNRVKTCLLQNPCVSRNPAPPTLLKLLTLPFLAVVLALAALVGWLSFRSANAAVDDAAQQWLSTALQRVGDEIDRQQNHADTLLQAAWPDGIRPSPDLSSDQDRLAARLLSAAQMHPSDRARVSYVSSTGQVLSVVRLGAAEAALEVRNRPAEPMTRHLLRPGDGGLAPSAAGAAVLEVPVAEPEPREQVWAKQVVRSMRGGWSPIELDGGSAALILSRARPVKDADGQVAGAVATPVSLKPIQDALAALKLPAQGVAFVVERSGLLVASSAGPVTRKVSNGTTQRLHVHDAESDLMRAAYDRSLPHIGSRSVAQPGRMTLAEPGLPALVSSFGRITDDGGHDWALIVAAPRAVFTGNLLTTGMQTVAATLAAIAAVLLIAAWIRRRLMKDVLTLSNTLQAVADGDLDTPPAAMHCAEMASLGDTLRRTQLRLRNDRSLGLANRESILARLHDRMRPGRRHNDAPLLALLVVDLNRFREVNRLHGHEAGDFVLQTIGKRLRQTVRDTDMVARWASDEFVVMLDGVATEDDAHRVRDQIERVLRDPVELGLGHEAAEIDGTAGLAVINLNTESSEPDALMRSAQADLVERKPPQRAKRTSDTPS
jgi:diguanylate cyclase (GGDEF)-like protein